MTTWVCLGLGSVTDFTRRSCPLMPRWTTRVSPLSRVNSKYLPRRPTDLMVRPSSKARKCLAEGCRRTERPLATETALILRPTTSRARSWRSVSTSGSSGTGQLLPRGAGRLLLGVLPARIEVDRAEDGLEGVGQDGRLGAPARTLFAAAEQEDLAHAQAARH